MDCILLYSGWITESIPSYQENHSNQGSHTTMSKRKSSVMLGSSSMEGGGGGGGGGGGLPYSVSVRRERSRELAQKRRTTYKSIMDDLNQVGVA